MTQQSLDLEEEKGSTQTSVVFYCVVIFVRLKFDLTFNFYSFWNLSIDLH